MRLARLVAAGLVVGVVTGFVVALLRSRVQPGALAAEASATADPLVVDRSGAAGVGEAAPAPVIDVRTPRRTVSG